MDEQEYKVRCPGFQAMVERYEQMDDASLLEALKRPPENRLLIVISSACLGDHAQTD